MFKVCLLLSSFLMFPFFGWLQIVDTSEIQEIEISSNANGQSKHNSPFEVDVLNASLIKRTLSTNFCDVLSFSGGLRMETDCQTCNYTQLRMNGMGGAYTQILINGKPLFSSLMGLYGLEQIPTNAIEQVEIVRGGGSVAYGSNAIAGTVNVITKMPDKNALNFQQTVSLIGLKTQDWNTQFNFNLNNKKKTASLIFFASLKRREELDVNADSFSEMPRIKGNSIGLSYDQKLFKKMKFQFTSWLLDEERRGGNAFELEPQESDQCEYRDQTSTINQGSISWSSKKLQIQLFSGFQATKRKHYTGANHADGWGNTANYTIQSGLQTSYNHLLFKAKMTWLFGLEQLIDDVNDEVPGYNYYVDQHIVQNAIYVQNQWEITNWVSIVAGGRLNHHSRVESVYATPRVAILLQPFDKWQFRLNYGKGFKAAQVLEIDMHMAFANGGVSSVVLDPNLKSETSDAFSFSADWNKRIKNFNYSVSMSVFYTGLHQPFVLEELGQDSVGNTYLLRTNGSSAHVQGCSFEGKLLWSKYLQLDLGFTIQKSEYVEAQQWSNSVEPVKAFLKTPTNYGFLTTTFFPKSKLSGGVNLIYTGKMLVPHFGGAPENNMDQLHQSESFYDVSLRLQYRIHIHRFEQNVIIGLALQNAFNSYQQDFDTTQYRDSNYIYGPSKPRTIQFSLRYELGAE